MVFCARLCYNKTTGRRPGKEAKNMKRLWRGAMKTFPTGGRQAETCAPAFAALP
ncbi:hypothetical protein CE91St44_24870 [Oscillospiraceae bacterium]|nr:hypothetical protein CE91St44_24870 [Oscillospiraceae bacterium]